MLAPDDKLKFSVKPYLAATPRFAGGADTPRDFLERCLADLAALEPKIGAFVVLNLERARATADESTARWRAGRPLSKIDGMPIGIKDIIETADMPTEQGSPLFAGFRSERDGASVKALREAGAVIVGNNGEGKGGKPFETPTYACRPPGVYHGPFKSEKGCMLYEIHYYDESGK